MIRVDFMVLVVLKAEVHLLDLYATYLAECFFELCPFGRVTLQVKDDKGLAAAGTLMQFMEPKTRLDQVIVF